MKLKNSLLNMMCECNF